MNNNLKKYIMFLMAVFMLNILSACSNISDTATQTNANSGNKTLSNQTSSNNPSSNQSQDFSNSADKTIEQLTINHRCIGCGRCSFLDPEHFSSRGGRNIPDIITQNNLESVSLQNAIKACPANAIELS